MAKKPTSKTSKPRAKTLTKKPIKIKRAKVKTVKDQEKKNVEKWVKTKKPAKVITGLPVKTLLANTPEKAVERSKQVRLVKRFASTQGIGIPTLRFETKSKDPTTGHIPPTHDTIIKLIDPKTQKVWVSCGCESFLFQWEYALTQHGASSIIHSSGEPALTTNPSNRPGVCLHLYKALSVSSTMKRLLELQKAMSDKKGK